MLIFCNNEMCFVRIRRRVKCCGDYFTSVR